METNLSSPEEMITYWKSLLQHGKKFLLEGDLWAGKTTITKWIAAWLEIHTDSVQSPTYTYMHIYEEKLLHIDMRRIETEQQFLHLWLLDLLDQYEYIVIEWPKREEHWKDTTWQRIIIQQHEWARICTRTPA
jgi:tRNA threonylcarbamoyladenosine biosynthesis protein TsaE